MSRIHNTQHWKLILTLTATATLGCSAPSEDASSTSAGGATGTNPAAAGEGAAAAPSAMGSIAGATDMTAGDESSEVAEANPAGGIMAPAELETGGVFVNDEAEVAAAAKEVNDENACAGTEVAPEEIEVEIEHEIEIEHEELKPVAIYVVLDNSLSMSESPGGGGGGGGLGGNAGGAADSKWNQAIEALTAFIEDDASAGVGMAIQYFHPLGAGDAPDECDGSGHGTPAVPMALLPDNSQALLDSLGTAAPTGFTPTVGALTGGVQYCDEFQQANPDTTCVVVLVTDGQPRGCGLCEDDADAAGGGGFAGGDCFDPNSETMLAPIAADGLAANVKTFTVGMDGITAEGFGLLDAIAIAGGTDCNPDLDGAETCDVSQTGAQGFAEALQSIRDSVITIETIIETEIVTETQTLDCQWGIPEPPDGDEFHSDLVNVSLSKEGGEPADIGGVASLDACAETGGYGWYYDNPDAPGQILACPETCTEIETATDPVVQVLLGCQTVPPPPR